MNKHYIKKIAQHLLFEVNREYNRYTLYDRPGPKLNNLEKTDNKTTITPSVPLKPTELTSSQNFNERPPIEDVDYVPSNTKELEAAIAAIARLVPAEQTKFFYDRVQSLLDTAQERQNKPTIANTEESNDMNSPVRKTAIPAKSAVKKESRQRINEVDDLEDVKPKRRVIGTGPGGKGVPPDTVSPKNPRSVASRTSATHVSTLDDDAYENSALAKARRAFQDRLNAEKERERLRDDKDFEVPAPPPDEGMDFGSIADYMGYASPSGARQEIERVTQKLNYFVNLLDRHDVDELKEKALDEYQELMIDSGIFSTELSSEDNEPVLTPEELEFISDQMNSNPEAIMSTDSFRYFFVMAFIAPAYQSAVTEGKSRLNAKMEQMGIPKEVRQTVFNQVLGTVVRDQARIEKNLKAVLPPEEAIRMSQRIALRFPALVKLASPVSQFDDGFVSHSINLWNGMSPSKKKQIFMKVIEETQGFDALKSDIIKKKQAQHGSSAPDFSRRSNTGSSREEIPLARRDTQDALRLNRRTGYGNMSDI